MDRQAFGIHPPSARHGHGARLRAMAMARCVHGVAGHGAGYAACMGYSRGVAGGVPPCVECRPASGSPVAADLTHTGNRSRPPGRVAYLPSYIPPISLSCFTCPSGSMSFWG